MRLRIGGDGERLFTMGVNGPLAGALFPLMLIFSLSANVRDNAICAGSDSPLAHLSFKLLLVMLVLSLLILERCPNAGGEYLPKV